MGAAHDSVSQHWSYVQGFEDHDEVISPKAWSGHAVEGVMGTGKALQGSEEI